MVCRRRSLRKRAAQLRSSMAVGGGVQAGVAGLGTVRRAALHQRLLVAALSSRQRCLRRHAGRRLRRQYPPRPDLGQCAGHGRAHELNAGYYASVPLRLPQLPVLAIPSDTVGLGGRRGPAAELPDDRAGRLLPVASQLHPRCVALPLLHAQHELGQSRRATSKPTACSAIACMDGAPWPVLRQPRQLSADHGLGLQRVLRALLDSCGP